MLAARRVGPGFDAALAASPRDTQGMIATTATDTRGAGIGVTWRRTGNQRLRDEDWLVALAGCSAGAVSGLAAWPAFSACSASCLPDSA